MGVSECLSFDNECFEGISFGCLVKGGVLWEGRFG